MGSSALKTVTAVLLAAVFFLLVFLPLPQKVGETGERYDCLWEDGTTSLMRYADAYAALEGINGEGNISLLHEGMRGIVSAGEGMKGAHALLQTGEIWELLAFRPGEVTSLEKAALYRVWKDTVWLDEGESFIFTGEKIVVGKQSAKTLVLLGGNATAAQLAGAERFYLRSRAELTYHCLVGATVKEIVPAPPYTVEGDAIYRETPLGKRLIAGMPRAERLKIDCAYMDTGALLPCEGLRSLELRLTGELAALFFTGKGSRIPQTLKQVRVTGGELVSHAFYGFDMLEEIDACDMDPAAIAADAFVDCAALRLVHTPRADVQLQGNYTAAVASCGCTVYGKS